MFFACVAVVILSLSWVITTLIELPAKRAAAIVKAAANYEDAALIAELSENLGEAMVGINEQEIELLMAERGK